MTPDPAWLLQFSPADRLALKRAFREAAGRDRSGRPDPVLIRVRHRYRQALEDAWDPAAAAHLRAVLQTLTTCRLECRAWVAPQLTHPLTGPPHKEPLDAPSR